MVMTPMRTSLVDTVYDSLRIWIIDHIREAGVRVNIDAVARSLAVSPTPVREALARLESEGFVTKTPAKGYSVMPPLTAAETIDLFAFRQLLEPWAAQIAAETVTDASRTRLRAELASCPHAPDGETYADYCAISDHDHRFHDLLLDLAGNVAARTAFARTNCHLHLFRLTYGRGMGDHALHEHGLIAAAVIAGDARGARDAMAQHLSVSQARILTAFD